MRPQVQYFLDPRLILKNNCRINCIPFVVMFRFTKLLIEGQRNILPMQSVVKIWIQSWGRTIYVHCIKCIFAWSLSVSYCNTWVPVNYCLSSIAGKRVTRCSASRARRQTTQNIQLPAAPRSQLLGCRHRNGYQFCLILYSSI